MGQDHRTVRALLPAGALGLSVSLASADAAATLASDSGAKANAPGNVAERLQSIRASVSDAVEQYGCTRDFRKLLDVYLLDKALYEILYELNSRPGWVRIPMLGMMSLPV